MYWFMACLGLEPRNFSTPWALKRRRFIELSDELVQIKSPEQQSFAQLKQKCIQAIPC